MIDRRTLKIQNDEFTILLNNAISTKPRVSSLVDTCDICFLSFPVAFSRLAK